MSGVRGDRPAKKVDLGKLILIRLRKKKKVAEMIADPKTAYRAKKIISEEIKNRAENSENSVPLTIEEIKKMPDIDINDIYSSLTVFENAKKGDVYPDVFLEEMFGTVDLVEIAYLFLFDKDTEWNWTKSQREEFTAQKKKQIISIISKNSINPQIKKPHPPLRIEKAMKEAKYSVDMYKTAEEQIKDVISAISAIIPIRMENIELAVKIPASFAAKAYGTVEKFGRVKQSEWQNNGSWIGVMDLPAGMEAEFLDKINKLTHGRAQIKILKRT